MKRRKTNIHDLEPVIRELVASGHHSPGIIAHKIGFSTPYVNVKLNAMANKGLIYRHEQITAQGKSVYFTAHIVPSHDPFNLTGRAYEAVKSGAPAH